MIVVIRENCTLRSVFADPTALSITNALLPHGFGDFRFCDVGTLSTLCFLLSVAYAVFVHGLFAVRLVLRATLVYGLLLSVVLGAYTSALFVATQYLTGATGTDKLTQFVVLLLAFSFDPLRRFLEEKTDGLLFGQEGGKEAPPETGPQRSCHRHCLPSLMASVRKADNAFLCHRIIPPAVVAAEQAHGVLPAPSVLSMYNVILVTR